MANYNKSRTGGMTFEDKNSAYFNTNSNHPLIQSSQEYILYKKYVSIHSEDRDMIKYPHSGEWEIEMPEDLLNVITIRLVDWTFPANYNTFSILNSNICMTFKINNPYNTNINGITDLLAQKIFEFLFIYKNNKFKICIEEGFYNPQQMVTELTNKFNSIVTVMLLDYFKQQSTNPDVLPPDQEEYKQAIELLIQAGGYDRFTIVYNNVSQKIWFGNICDQFTLTTENEFTSDTPLDNLHCVNKGQLPDFSNWGLPSYLGLSRCNTTSVNGSDLTDITQFTFYNGIVVPRFFYGDVNPGDNGYWLLPNPILVGSNVNWVECAFKINLMGYSHFYMELAGNNCIDETSPYNLSKATYTSNVTNGVVNSSFAKISVPTTPISQWFDRDALPYKFYYPPAERMRRLKIKFRYHNGELVNFGVFNYSFVLEFALQLPQILRNSNTVNYPSAIK